MNNPLRTIDEGRTIKPINLIRILTEVRYIEPNKPIGTLEGIEG